MSPRLRPRWWLAVIATLLAGCAAPTPAPTTVTVFAAASLQSTFTEIGHRFEAAHPGVRVAFTFAGSQTLAEQLLGGARADVFASADEATMRPVTEAGLAPGPVGFATNRLAIAVPADNPAEVRNFADLSRPGLALVICAPEVPCGRAAQKIALATHVRLTPVSEEQSVTDVLAKVRAGEADAGLVYRTDLNAGVPEVRGIEFAESDLALTTAQLVVLDGPQRELGAEFASYLLGDQGHDVLADAGFGFPA